MPISIIPLGAGQDIGRSCILVKFTAPATPPEKKARLDHPSDPPCAVVMLDCGFHVGDEQQPFPDFERGLGPSRQLDVCLISHYHIDHVGGLPMLTERYGYTGPVLMTEPTKALSTMMIEESLQDGRRTWEKFSRQEIAQSVTRAQTMQCRETVTLQSPLGDVAVTCFRAGHVLGAAMFHVQLCATGESVLYTGDFNATPDRTLGAAEAMPLAPPGRLDVLVSESTYGGTTRGSQRSQEVEFLAAVTEAVSKGGKVLIPTFSLGRVQEMCVCLETHWRRVGLSRVPIVLHTRNAEQVTAIHAAHERWGQSRVVLGATAAHVAAPPPTLVRVGEPTQAELAQPGLPVVLLATSAMLQGGLSLRAFGMWAGSPDNLVVFPGHCVRGTVGHRLLAANLPGPFQLDRSRVEVRCKIVTAPFSAHTDAKGIVRLAHQTQPRHVVLVHGVLPQMEALKRRIEKELPGTVVSHPANWDEVAVASAANPTAPAPRVLFGQAVVCEPIDWAALAGRLPNAAVVFGAPGLVGDGRVWLDSAQGRLRALVVRDTDAVLAAQWLKRCQAALAE